MLSEMRPIREISGTNFKVWHISSSGQIRPKHERRYRPAQIGQIACQSAEKYPVSCDKIS